MMVTTENKWYDCEGTPLHPNDYVKIVEVGNSVAKATKDAICLFVGNNPHANKLLLTIKFTQREHITDWGHSCHGVYNDNHYYNVNSVHIKKIPKDLELVFMEPDEDGWE